MTKLTVAQLCLPSLGGSSTVAVRLAEAMAKRGHRSLVVSSSLPASAHLGIDVGRQDGHAVMHDGVEYRALPEVGSAVISNDIVSFVALQQLIASLIEHEGVDVIHAHYALPLSLAAVQARMLSDDRTAVICTLHGTDVSSGDRTTADIVGAALRQCDGVTSVSETLANQSIDLFGIKKPEVVYNWVPEPALDDSLSAILRAEHAPNGETLMVHVSNFRPVKQATQTIDVLRAIDEQQPARLLLVGDGPDLAETLNKAYAMGLEDKVFHLGQRYDVMMVLKACDFLLLPSQSEGMPLVVLEAASVGTPVVAYDMGDMSRSVINGETGYLAKQWDLADFVQKAMDITKDRRFVEMGESARQYVTTHFEQNKLVDQYETLYTQAVDERRRVGEARNLIPLV